MSNDISYCPKCNAPVQPGTRYCANCGNDLSMPQAVPAPIPGPMPAQSWQTSEQSKQRIIEAVSQRGHTDEIIPEWWVLLPIIAVLLIIRSQHPRISSSIIRRIFVSIGCGYRG